MYNFAISRVNTASLYLLLLIVWCSKCPTQIVDILWEPDYQLYIKIKYITEWDEISKMIISVSWIAFSLGIKINYHIWSIICHIFQGHHPLNIGKNTISLCIKPKMCTHNIENINYVFTLNLKWILITIFSNRRWYLKYHCSIMWQLL